MMYLNGFLVYFACGLLVILIINFVSIIEQNEQIDAGQARGLKAAETAPT